MHTPLVSVIITAYNAERFLRETLDSVVAQTFDDYEVVLVDDGCTDGTADIALEYGRVRCIRQTNCGQPAARNRGIAAARGSYLAFLDADDLWLKEKLEKQVSCLFRRPDVPWVYSDAIYFDSKTRRTICQQSQGTTMHEGDILRFLLLSPFIPSSTPVIKASVFREVGPFDERPYLRIGEDWNMWLRIAEKYRIALVSEPLALIRVHESNMARTADPDYAYRSKCAIIEAAIARNGSRVADLRAEAVARISVSAGFRHIRHGNYRSAWRMLASAVRLSPRAVVTSVYLTAPTLPYRLRKLLFALRSRLSFNLWSGR